MPDSALAITLCGLALPNPVLAASGTFGYGIEFEKIVDLDQLGGLVTKGISREPIAGNPAPRLWHTEGGMMNSVGLQNVGVKAFATDKLPKLRKYRVAVIANVFGYAIEDYLEVIRVLEDAEGIAGYELNVSCPNTKEGGIYFSSDPALLGAVVGQVRAISRRPLIVKLSPNVARIQPFAKAAEEAGADAVSLVNTFIGLAIDIKTRKPWIGAGFGGLSGPAIKPLALRLVYEASRAVKIPVIGIGGIKSGKDAAEFLIAGASAVQVGTGNFLRPDAPIQVAKQLGNILSQLEPVLPAISLEHSICRSLTCGSRRIYCRIGQCAAVAAGTDIIYGIRPETAEACTMAGLCWFGGRTILSKETVLICSISLLD